MARFARLLLPAFLVAWFVSGFWNAAKPPPPGTHVISLPSRVSEADVEFLADSPRHSEILERELAAIDSAEQLIVIDQSPVARAVARHLLARKRARPHLEILVVTDPALEAFGGTPAEYLATLERAGIVVARVRLDRLRDSNPLYSGLWRLCLGWWSDPLEEAPGNITLRARLRMLNLKSDRRQLAASDDGAGGWISIVASMAWSDSLVTASDAPADPNAAWAIRGPLAQDIAASELRIAAWSSEDDRLPAPPALRARGLGSIDARFLSEGAVQTALLDAIAAAGSGDAIDVAASICGDRRLIEAMSGAAARGAHLRLLLDPGHRPNPSVAAELLRIGGGRVEIHWYPPGAAQRANLLIARHRSDVWVDLGSANFTRRDLADLNLTAGMELRMPMRAAPARAVTDYFAAAWSAAAPYERFADESESAYWHYRLAEATGLTDF